MKPDGSVIISTRIDTSGFHRGAADIKNSLGKLEGMVKKLGAVIGGIFAAKKLIQFGQEAIELGSDLQEVQNVVDSVFTTMSAKVDEFASSAAITAGLSETMAKKYVGTFGAMAKSFGFTEDEALEMSTALTQLSGDVASFYNLTQDEAYTKLKSVFTGETESIKELGVVITQTALDQYALANGFGKTTANMSEQEKVALRYKFVLDQLSTASGDFIRTSDGWANQVRILKLQIDSLKATIGQGLINVFTPVIKVINIVLAKLATLANAFKAFTELITGGRSSGSTTAAAAGLADTELSNIGEEYRAAAEGAQNLAESTQNAANATREAEKEANKYLSPLDQINKFSKENASQANSQYSPAGSTGNISAGNGLEIDYGQLAEGQNEIEEISDSMNRFVSLIRDQDWAGLGDYVASGINSGVEKIKKVISWENVGPAITKFTDSFTKAFNSITERIDFNLIGRTIGTGFNTVVKTLNGLITGIHWKNLGAKFASGINGIVSEVNWTEFGNLLGNKFMISWNMFYGFVTNLNFNSIGDAIGNSINGALEKIDMKTIGTTISEFAKGLLDTFISAVKKIEWKKVGEKITDLLSSIDWAGLAKRLFQAGITLMKGLLQAFNQLPAPVKVAAIAISGFFAVIKGMSVIKTMNSSLSSLITTGRELKKNWSTLKNVSKTVFDAMKTVITTSGAKIAATAKGLISTVKSITGAFTPLHACIAILVTAVGALIMNWGRMSTLGRYVGVFGALAIAAGTLAVAMGAVRSAVSAGLVVAAITGGVAAVGYAISTARRNAQQMQSGSYIPYLAKGAVIPPNAPFMAVLGDQKNGNNIEVPEAYLRKVFREEIGNANSGKGGKYQFIAQMNRRTIFDEMIEEAKLRQSSSGRNPFELA